jgi:arylsulfatase A-like enzyme
VTSPGSRRSGLPGLITKVRRRLSRKIDGLRRSARRPGHDARSSRTLAARSASDRPALVLVIVIDGLRPDSINLLETPNLAQLREEGVEFTNAHAVFPSGTRVNAAAIVTGAYPDVTGLLSNSMYLPQVDVEGAWSTQRHDDLLSAKQALGGRLLLVEGLGETLDRHGMTLAAVSSASTGSTLLLNPMAPDGIGVLVNGAFDPGRRVAYPDDVNKEVLDRFGTAPPKSGRSRSRNALVDWTEKVLMEYIVPELAPDVVIDWLSEPDHTQHSYGVGSPEARRALGNVDRNVGYVVSKLEDLDLAARTDLIVLSDHGVTKYERAIDVGSILVDAGLKDGPDTEDVVVAANGPCAHLYVRDHDERRVRDIVTYLQAQAWSGVIFTRAANPTGAGDGPPNDAGGPSHSAGWVGGTFSLDLIRLFHPERSCDVLLTFAWDSTINEFGVPGTDLTTAVGTKLLHSGHGSMSPWAMRTTLFAKGPSFKSGTVVSVPAGHVDLVPTILSLKGIEVPPGLDGRVLTEAIRDGADERLVDVETRTLTTSNRDGSYRAAVTFSTMNGHRYLDKGFRLPALSTS